jgi:hypothetical protein
MRLFGGRLAFFRRCRLVLSQEFEVYAVGGADRLQFFRGSAGGIRVFTDDARKEEAFGVLEIADEFDGAVAWTDDMQIYGELFGLFVPPRFQR